MILKEPDLGSAFVLIPMALTMMFVAGVPTKYLAAVVWAALAGHSSVAVDILFAPPNWRCPSEDQLPTRPGSSSIWKRFRPRNATATDARKTGPQQRTAEKVYNA